MKRPDLNHLHFRKGRAKAKYRLQLTVGVVVATVAGMAAGDALTIFASVVNGGTAVMWIWE